VNDATNLFSESKYNNRYTVLTNKPCEPLQYKLQQFYLACDAIENYTEAVALFGTRRLGKTVALNQLWDRYHTNKSVYIKITQNSIIDDIMPFIMQHADMDYLFIDEFTNIQALDIVAADLLDYCKAYNIKVVLSGTNSLLLAIAVNNSACGRLNIISFNPPNLLDLMSIKGTTLSDFIDGQNTLYAGDSYLEDISNDIEHSISSLGDYKNAPYEQISANTVRQVLKVLIEAIIFNKSTKLPNDALVFYRKYYENLDFNEIEYRVSVDKDTLAYLYNVLKKLSLVIELPIHNFTDEKTNKFKLYLTTPVLYANLLEEYTKEYNRVKFGILFESVVISQIYSKVKQNRNLRMHTFRDNESEIEFDFIIENLNANKVILGEVKSSPTKHGKYFKREEVLNYYKDFEITNLEINPENLVDVLIKFDELNI
jgi:hypothetical protein